MKRVQLQQLQSKLTIITCCSGLQLHAAFLWWYLTLPHCEEWSSYDWLWLFYALKLITHTSNSLCIHTSVTIEMPAMTAIAHTSFCETLMAPFSSFASSSIVLSRVPFIPMISPTELDGTSNWESGSGNSANVINIVHLPLQISHSAVQYLRNMNINRIH